MMIYYGSMRIIFLKHLRTDNSGGDMKVNPYLGFKGQCEEAFLFMPGVWEERSGLRNKGER
jgi:hypothetical protein